MQQPQRCFPSPALYHYLSLAFSLTSFSPSFLSHRLFTQSSRATGALRGNTGSAKEFIEFVVQLIPWRQAGVESGMRGWRAGGREGSGERGGRVNVKGWNCVRGGWLKITRQSLNWNGSCSNLLPPYTYLPMLWRGRNGRMEQYRSSSGGGGGGFPIGDQTVVNIQNIYICDHLVHNPRLAI